MFFLDERLCGTGSACGDQRIFAATAVFIAATVLSLSVYYPLVGKLPIMPLVSGVVVVVFGGLTLALQDETVHQAQAHHREHAVRPRRSSAGSGSASPCSPSSSTACSTSTDEGWRKLTLRWALFFFVLAALNEIVWRTQTDRFLGQLQGLRHHAADDRLRLAQTPLLMRYEAKTDEDAVGD